MMKTLYVHIGMAKTGTTALQYFLWENRQVLEKHGYCYPSMRCAYSDLSTANETRNGHFLVNDTWIDGVMEHDEEDLAMYRAGMDEVVRLFETYDQVILSDESIWVGTYKRRKRLWEDLKADGQAHGFQVKIIVYLRRQDQYIASVYKQKLKQRSSATSRETWEEYASHIPKTRQLDYFKKLEQIREFIGKENMIVRRYDREGFYGGSIYADFLYQIGLSYSDEYRLVQAEANQSLLGNTAEMKRIINEIEGFDRDDDRLMRKILYADSEISKKQVEAELFSREEAERFLKEYEESNARVAELYCADGKPLFDDTIPDVPKYDKNNPYMIEDVLRFSAIGLKYMREELALAEKERKAQKAQIKDLKEQIRQLKERDKALAEQTDSTKKEIKDVRNGLLETRDKLHHPVRAVMGRFKKS